MARLGRSKPSGALLSKVLESWLAHLDLAGRSTATLTLYRQSMRLLVTNVGDIPVGDVTSDHIRTWLMALRETHKPASIAARYRCARAFFNWAEAEERIDATPMKRIPAPKVAQTEPPGFSDAELTSIVATCNPRTPVGARDRALLLVFAGTALRLSEVAGLTRQDVIQAGPSERYIRIVGKGDKERLVALESSVRKALADWLEYRDDDDPALWIGERGRLQSHALYDIIRKHGEAAGVENVHPHRFRNFALSNMLASGLDPAAVQRLAGHANLAQTQHYVNHNEQRRANDRLLEVSPLSRIDWTKGRKRKSKG